MLYTLFIGSMLVNQFEYLRLSPDIQVLTDMHRSRNWGSGAILLAHLFTLLATSSAVVDFKVTGIQGLIQRSEIPPKPRVSPSKKLKPTHY